MSDVEAVARAHANRVVAGDPGARADFAPEAEMEPADLLDRLLQGGFRRFELVAHARIGAYHIFKTRYDGPATVVVQARWVERPPGRWQVVEAEVARTAAGEGV